MEYLKSFLSDLQDRFRNPFIGSFIISWLLFNWQITILVIHFLTDSNSTLTFDELVIRVNEFSNNWNSIYCPLFSSIFYIVVFPFIRIGISFLQAWFTRHRNEFELKGSKEGSVSVNKYLILREEYVQKLSELKEIIDSEDTYRREVIGLQNQLMNSQRNEKDNSDRYNKLARKSYFNELTGFWVVTLKSLADKPLINPQIIYNGKIVNFNIDKIRLEGANIQFFNKDSAYLLHQGRILYYEHDIDNTSNAGKQFPIFIYCELTQEENHTLKTTKQNFSLVFKLKQFKNYEYLEGIINDCLKIEMKVDKKADSIPSN